MPTPLSAPNNANFLGGIVDTFTNGLTPCYQRFLDAVKEIETNPADPRVLIRMQQSSTELASLNTACSGTISACRQMLLNITNHLA